MRPGKDNMHSVHISETIMNPHGPNLEVVAALFTVWVLVCVGVADGLFRQHLYDSFAYKLCTCVSVHPRHGSLS